MNSMQSPAALAPASAASMLEQVRALAPLISANAEAAERARKPIDAVIDALAQTGVFTAFVPRRFGGLEIDMDTYIDVGLAVSEACTSTGWVTTFYMEHNWMLAQFSEQAQHHVWSRRAFMLAPASISPNGRADKVEGGYRLSGRWAWGTGVMHADWVILNGTVQGEKPEPRLFLVPREAIVVDEVWDAAGMQGTGSNDMIADDIFVSEAFSEPLRGMAVGRGQGAVLHDSACFRVPMLPLLCIAAAIPALGAARRALSLFQQRIAERVLYGSGARQSDGQGAHMRLGRAAGQVDAAEMVLRGVGQELQRWGAQEGPCPMQERARLRLLVAGVVRQCRDCVATLMEASGASAHMRTHPMQRIQRDINTLSCHTVFDLDIASENIGRLLLGMEPASPV